MGSIIEWSIAALCAVLAIILLSGRGAFLIAGYNTASKAEKAMYDEKKLCRVMGSGMGAIAVLMAMSAVTGYDKPAWVMLLMPVGIIVIVVVMLILSNTICKAKNPPKDYYVEEEEKSSKSTKKIVIGIVVFTAVITIGISSTLVTGDIKTTITDGKINIDGSYWSDYDISVESVKQVSLKEDIVKGARTNGMGSVKLSEGSFKNTEFGAYTLYVYNKCNTYIVIDTADGIVVINEETAEGTKKLYEALVKAVE